MNKIYCAIDMEFNQPSEKIISVGGVIGDITTSEIQHEFEYFIKIDEPVSEYITKLTTITDEMLLDGITLQAAHQHLKHLRETYKFSPNPITWGGGDSLALRLALNMPGSEFVFGRRWIDTKTIYQAWRTSQELKTQAGLAKAMSKSGLNFKGRKHTAKDDARNTFLFYAFLLKKFRP